MKLIDYFMAPRMLTENESLESHYVKIFEGDLMADLTPKRIYVGDDPGNGKTHLLLHVSEKLSIS